MSVRPPRSSRTSVSSETWPGRALELEGLDDPVRRWGRRGRRRGTRTRCRRCRCARSARRRRGGRRTASTRIVEAAWAEPLGQQLGLRVGAVDELARARPTSRSRLTSGGAGLGGEAHGGVVVTGRFLPVWRPGARPPAHRPGAMRAARRAARSSPPRTRGSPPASRHASRRGSARRWLRRAVARRLRVIRPASSSTRRCLEMAGWEIENGAPSSPTVRSPPARLARMARRVGSARAPKTLLSWSVWPFDNHVVMDERRH